MDQSTEEEVRRRIALAVRMYRETLAEADYSYQNIFGWGGSVSAHSVGNLAGNLRLLVVGRPLISTIFSSSSPPSTFLYYILDPRAHGSGTSMTLIKLPVVRAICNQRGDRCAIILSRRTGKARGSVGAHLQFRVS